MIKLIKQLVCFALTACIAGNTFSQCGTFPPSGLVTVSNPNTVINGYFPGESSAVAGANTLTVGAADSRGGITSINAGDLIMVIQMQGADINSDNDSKYGSGSTTDNGKGYITNTNLIAGKYEYNVVQSVLNLGLVQIITLQYPLVNNFYTRAFNLGTTQSFQAVVIPKYHDVTINSGASVTCPAWNGTTGGVVAITASNLVTNNGEINVAGKGFRGGGGKQFGGTGLGLTISTRLVNLMGGQLAVERMG
ncbi:MAG: hypothetical protein EOO88_61535, partial [Pedobacter sp.]